MSVLTKTISQRQEELVKEFEGLADWDTRYKKIIEMGKALPAFPEIHRTEDNKVKGCQSQVWLHAELSPDQKIIFHGDSDALIVKGLVALLLRVYSPAQPQEVLKNPPEFLKSLGLSSHLSPSRSNGLHSMMKQIQHYALAFDFLVKSQKKL